MTEYSHFIPLALGTVALAISFIVYHRNSKEGERATEAMQLVRSIISYNSSELIQYHFLGLERHKKLKVSLMAVNALKNEGLAESLRQLDNYLSNNLTRVALYNFKYLEKHFANRSKAIPRVSLYLFKGDDNAYTLVRNTVTKEDNPIYHIAANTSLSHVVHTGRYFLCNDVGLASKKAEYIQEDRGKIGSTLVVPLSVSNNALSEPFSQLLNMDQVERKIFGLLTIDHPEKDYFKEDDVALLFIVSELLTNFLLAYTTFTDLSECYHMAHELIETKSANKWFQPTLVNSRG